MVEIVLPDGAIYRADIKEGKQSVTKDTVQVSRRTLELAKAIEREEVAKGEPLKKLDNAAERWGKMAAQLPAGELRRYYQEKANAARRRAREIQEAGSNGCS